MKSVFAHFPMFIPSPPQREWHLGPFPVRAYALAILTGIVVAYFLANVRLKHRAKELVGAQGVAAVDGKLLDIALITVPLGIIGGRIYHLITTPAPYFGKGGDPWRAFAIWDGGLGIWGAVALGCLGVWLTAKRAGVRFTVLLDCIAPGVVIAQGIGRIGNYFNQELFGGPTRLPWALKVSAQAAINAGYAPGTTFHPTFLYELIWDIALGVALILVDRKMRLGHGQVFFLYALGYTIGRFWVEHLRIDTAYHFLGLRLNDWTSILVGLAALIAFVMSRRRHKTREATIWYPGKEPSAPSDVPGEHSEAESAPSEVDDEDHKADSPIQNVG